MKLQARLLLTVSVLMFLCVFANFSKAHAVDFNCERTTNSSQGFTTFQAFESWFPKSKQFDGTDFKEAGGGSKAMVWSRTATSSNGASVEQKWRLLPNSVLIGRFKPYGNFMAVDNIRYKCEINSNELRTKLASQSESNSSSSGNSEAENNTRGCFNGNPKICTDGQVCYRATRMVSGKRQWESGQQWLPFVNEAKSRSLNCDVVDSSNPSSTSSSKLDKAKATCTELGFTAGTEKHGSCVLKMMDN